MPSRLAVRSFRIRPLHRAPVGAPRPARSFLLSLSLAAAALTAPAPLAAQDVRRIPVAGPTDAPLRVFLDCRVGPWCREDFYVLALPWVDFTRDRIDADVQVLFRTLEAGGGGQSLSIAFLGRNRFLGRADTVSLTTLPNAAEDAVRRRVADAMKVVLAPWALRTAAGPRLRVDYDAPAAPPAAAERTHDPWNLWVAQVGLNGNGNVQSRYRGTNLNGNVLLRRIAERYKFQGGAYFSSRFDRFRLSDTSTFTNRVRSVVGFARSVWAIDDHWSWAVVARYDYDEFRNTRAAWRAAPGIEYNVFPWRDAASRQLTVAWGPSLESFAYEDTTVFGRVREVRPRHVFTANLATRQSWGTTNVTLRAGQFLDDLAKSNVGLETNAQLRIVKGLALDIIAGASRVRDQLFLARGGLTEDQILVRQRALATNFEGFLAVGVSYTFGSIYNTVVNPRVEPWRVGPN